MWLSRFFGMLIDIFIILIYNSVSLQKCINYVLMFDRELGNNKFTIIK